jgi:hypothetical protein
MADSFTSLSSGTDNDNSSDASMTATTDDSRGHGPSDMIDIEREEGEKRVRQAAALLTNR